MLKIKTIILITLILIGTTTVIKSEENKNDKLILGGSYLEEIKIEEDDQVDNIEEYYKHGRFFRPSNMPILNNKREDSIYDNYLPKKLLKTPEDAIINYYSVLREAANPTDDINTGCGTLGYAKAPYPVAYNFLSKDYKQKVSYEEYLKSFENKLHINLVKLNKVGPDEDKPNDIKYFVELEVIEGSKEKIGLFAYYYGYIYLQKEDGQYKIKDMKYSPENYLCAPYHGWSYDAESFVSTEYGYWCSLVDGDIEVKQDGYEKRVYFKSKEKDEYYVLFYQLTNGVDIKIEDYKKNKNGKWELIYIDPEKCLDKKNK